MVKLYEILEIAEVLGNEGETLVVDDVFGGVFILVERIKMSGGESLQDGARVPSAAEGDVGVDAFGIDVQSFNTLV